MTRIWTEGFELGTLSGVFDAGYSGSINTVVKRSGNYSWKPGTYGYGHKSIPPLSSFYFRTGFSSAGTGGYHGIAFFNGSTRIASVYNIGRTILSAYIGSTKISTDLLINIASGTFGLIEIFFKLDPVNGQFIIKLNGIELFNYLGNTQGSSSATTINIIGLDGNFASLPSFDDVALNDTSGDFDNSWCGDGKIVALKPNAVGDKSEFVNSAGTSVNNFQYVDDIPPNETDYVAADVAGKQDLYNFENIVLSQGYKITRVWPTAVAKDAATGSIKLITKPANIVFKDAASTQLSTIYAVVKGDEMRVNPETGLEWTDGDVSALQAGIEIQ